VEDNPDVARAQAISLERAGHQVTVFADGPSALSGIADLKPAAVLIDIALPGMDGRELAAKLRKQPNLRHALFIALSGFERRSPAGKSGDHFDHYFVKPVDSANLLALLDAHTRAGAADSPTDHRAERRKPLRVLLVEDNADLAVATERLLRAEGLEVRTALSGKEALEAAADFQPKLTLCDLHLPDMKAPELVRALRSNPATRHTRAVILTALSEPEIRAFNRGAKEMGVNEFISKPLTSDVLQGLVAKLRPPRRMSAR
jgi:CheY-like chemotaxis protein